MNWQDFEYYSREYIRSMGYYVHPGPYQFQHKNVDIYGEHLSFSKYFQNDYYPHLFIGECKKWKNPVGPSVVYELQGLISSLPAELKVEAAIFSYNGFSKKANLAMQEANIHHFDSDTVSTYLQSRFQFSPAGEISRPSFPGYTNLQQLMDLIDSCINLDLSTFSSSDLKDPLASKNWTKGNMTWITSLLNIAVILNLLSFEGKSGQSNVYKLLSDTILIDSKYKEDSPGLIKLLGPVATKNRWLREIIFYIRLTPGSSITSVAKALEYTQAGFDVDSIKMAIKLGRDLDLIKFDNGKLFLNPSTIQMLW